MRRETASLRRWYLSNNLKGTEHRLKIFEQLDFFRSCHHLIRYEGVFVFIFMMGLEFELRALHAESRHSIT
jgi:hypothetical protein